MKRFDIVMLLLSVICCETHFQVHLKLPRYALVEKNATLRCEYDVPLNHIHKVEWLKGDRKLFGYIKGRNPPFYIHTIPGGKINTSNSNESQLSLYDVGFHLSGLYSCSVTTETPIYTKMSEEKPLVVVKLQTQNPKITFNKKKFVVGEWLQVNCTSGFAHPIPELTWLMNGNEVRLKEYFIKSFPEQSSNASTVQISFQIQDEHSEGFVLTCLSTIPGFMGKHVHHNQYADHRSDSIKIDILKTKISSNARCRSIGGKMLILMLIQITYSILRAVMMDYG